MDAGVLAAGPVVPPDPLQVGDLDEDQRHDREEEDLPAHRRTVSAPGWKRNRPIGLKRPAQEHRPSARDELRERSDERNEDEGENPEAKNEFAAHGHRTRGRPFFFQPCGFAAHPPGNKSGDRKEGARMYVGLGTILLIVLIIILLIWIF